jgi:hypothetical protein
VQESAPSTLPAPQAKNLRVRRNVAGGSRSMHPQQDAPMQSNGFRCIPASLSGSGKVRNIRQESAAFETLHLQTKGPQIPLQVESGVLFPENNLFQVELNLFQYPG